MTPPNRPTAGRPSIIRVAREAGVSPATAGRALGGYGRVSATAKERVLSAADRIGYRANGLARSLIVGSSFTIGVVVSDIGNPFFARSVRGVSDAARAAGYEVLLFNTDGDSAAEARALTVIQEKRVDGVVIATSTPDNVNALRDLVAHEVSVVLLDRPVPALTGVDSVTATNKECAASAVQTLLHAGHRRIAIVTEAADSLSEILRAGQPGDGRGLRPSAARLAGYVAALGQADLPVDHDLVIHSRYDRSSAHEATAELLARERRPTAIFCTDDVLSSGAFEAIQASRLDCPADISLIGFDDQDWTRLVRPQLTVVSQPDYEMGAEAAALLLKRLIRARRSDGTPVKSTRAVHRRLDAKLIHRDSVAPPPAK